ncbi:hypothetical protein [Streptomyces sp. CAU 1734]|uniref:hypothetical protein n=1 Tax=Streptomyces sp. CAU 1734 TaxID=3140360 RepID=UPI0032600AF9
MSEAATATTEALPQEADGTAEAEGAGKHRGVAAAEESAQEPHGKHRKVSSGAHA